MNSSDHSATTHFGYHNVRTHEKVALVKGVFDSVAKKYDVMNDAMSLGVHRLWKQYFVEQLHLKAGKKLLDVAGGTGDISFKARQLCKELDITILDINESMLQEGRNRAWDKGQIQAINWLCGNAEQLPVPDQSYDYYTIAFGIRNVTHIDRALKEAYRVLKPGGQFFCLEFSTVEAEILRKCYELYSFHCIPKLGQILTRDKESYQYLVESIQRFPNQQDFASMIEQAGFLHVRYTNLTGGVVAIHQGWRI